MQSHDPKVLPCPFCGCTPKKAHYHGDERNGYMDRTVYCCTGCGARVFAQGTFNNESSYADNSTVGERALAKWNTRTKK